MIVKYLTILTDFKIIIKNLICANIFLLLKHEFS